MPTTVVRKRISRKPGSRGPSLDRLFRTLVKQWRRDTAVDSSVQEKVLHSAYQQIIGLGPAATPLILAEMKQRPGQWFWALRAITREDPVEPSNAGDISSMTRAWLDWGRRKGLVA